MDRIHQLCEKSGRRGPGGANGRWGHVYAALDLGTNNCRLLIAKPRRHGFTVIDAFSRTVCLGESCKTTGELQEAAMDRALQALQTCVLKMERRGVTVARSIATEACRTARNGSDFIDRVHRETGLHFDVITPAEEARLAATGCWPLVDRHCETALVFDIGGGSTELIWLDLTKTRRKDRPHIAAWTSLPVGVVTLTERFGTPHVEPPVFPAMVEEVRSLLEPFTGADALRPAFGTERVHLLGTSGTVTTLAGILLGLERYDRDKVDGTWLAMDRISGVCNDLAGRTFRQRMEVPCVGADRADFVVAGCAILEAIQSLWPSSRLRVADRGLREGMLLTLMSQADRSARRARRKNGGHRRSKPPAPMAKANSAS